MCLLQNADRPDLPYLEGSFYNCNWESVTLDACMSGDWTENSHMTQSCSSQGCEEPQYEYFCNNPAKAYCYDDKGMHMYKIKLTVNFY